MNIALDTAKTAAIRWRVLPEETPRVRRRCAACGAVRPFYSSGRFRVNANGKRLDIWLIYRCLDCDATWNFPAAERLPVPAVDPALLAGALANDPDTARRCAFDLAALRRAGVEVEACASWRVTRSGAPDPNDGERPWIVIETPLACMVRLDRFLAKELAISRGQLKRWFAQGALVVVPGDRHALKKNLRDGLAIRLPAGLPPGDWPRKLAGPALIFAVSSQNHAIFPMAPYNEPVS